MKLNMRPPLSRNNHLDVTGGDVEVAGNCGVRFAPLLDTRSNNKNDLGGYFGLAILLPPALPLPWVTNCPVLRSAWHTVGACFAAMAITASNALRMCPRTVTAFLYHIASIVTSRAGKQMRRANASRVVAGVASEYLRGQWSVSPLAYDPMDRLYGLTIPNRAIVISFFAGNPRPAVASEINLAPKSNCRRQYAAFVEAIGRTITRVGACPSGEILAATLACKRYVGRLTHAVALAATKLIVFAGDAFKASLAYGANASDCDTFRVAHLILLSRGNGESVPRTVSGSRSVFCCPNYTILIGKGA